jgi:hypothetical protein
MTWIVGTPTSFGYVAAVSDVQVSWGDVRHDCLQKVYAVAPFIAAGFAGSVRLGFNAIEHLSSFLPPAGPGESWIPRWVAWKWHRSLNRYVWNDPRVSSCERAHGLSIMLMGVRPWDNSGCIGGGRPDVVVLSSERNFEPQYFSLGEVASIGSGSGNEFYRRELDELSDARFRIMQAEVGSPNGMGALWTWSLQRRVMANPMSGVSQHVHRILVRRGSIVISPLNLKRIDRSGDRTLFEMPSVSQSREEFEQFALRRGLPVGEACA